MLHAYPPVGAEGRDARLDGQRNEPTRVLHEVFSVLCEDDGESYAYQTDDCLLTRFTLATEGEGLSEIHLRREIEGDYEPGYGAFEVVVHGVEWPPSGVTRDGEANEPGEIDEDQPALRLRVGPFEHLGLRWA